MDTLEVAYRVRQILNANKIQQGTFAQHVLGMSQGFEMLLWPKPWTMLSKKDRETYRKMYTWTTNPNNIHSLITLEIIEHINKSNFISSSSPPAISAIPQQYPIFNTSPNETPHPTNVCPCGCMSNLPQSFNLNNNSFRSDEINNNLKQLDLTANKMEKEEKNPKVKPQMLKIKDYLTNSGLWSNPVSVLSSCQSSEFQVVNYNSNPSLPVPQSPSISDTSCTKTDSEISLAREPPQLNEALDTEEVSSRVREILTKYKIGQRVFGESLLQLSQGRVSELLWKPKPWDMLSIKGREPYLKMNAWLSDPNNIEKLTKKTNESSRKNGLRVADYFEQSLNTKKRSCPKLRFCFTENQKETLQREFARAPYPSTKHIEEVAKQLELPVRTVHNWFHNHRMRNRLFKWTGKLFFYVIGLT